MLDFIPQNPVNPDFRPSPSSCPFPLSTASFRPLSPRVPELLGTADHGEQKGGGAPLLRENPLRGPADLRLREPLVRARGRRNRTPAPFSAISHFSLNDGKLRPFTSGTWNIHSFLLLRTRFPGFSSRGPGGHAGQASSSLGFRWPRPQVASVRPDNWRAVGGAGGGQGTAEGPLRSSPAGQSQQRQLSLLI